MDDFVHTGTYEENSLALNPAPFPGPPVEAPQIEPEMAWISLPIVCAGPLYRHPVPRQRP